MGTAIAVWLVTGIVFLSVLLLVVVLGGAA